MKHRVVLCLGVCLLLGSLVGCQQEKGYQETALPREPLIARTAKTDSGIADALLGMEIALPDHWREEGSLIFSFRETKAGLVRRTFMWAPSERVGVYRSLTGGGPLTAENYDQVEEGFSRSLVPILELVLWDKGRLDGSPEDLAQAPHFAVLQEDERFVWLIGRWLRAKDINLTEEGAAELIQVRGEGEQVKENLHLGVPLTADYAFSGALPLPPVMQDGEETTLTDTLVLLWAGQGPQVKAALKLWQTASWWDGPPVVTVRLPAMGDEDMPDDVAGSLKVLYPTEAWEDVIDLVETVPLYLYVNGEGQMKAVPSYATKEGWLKGWQHGF